MVKIILSLLTILFFLWIFKIWWTISKWIFLGIIILFFLTLLKGI